MIELRGVSAKGKAVRGRAPAPIRNVSLSWSRGVLAVVGTPQDGTSTLLGVLSGTMKLGAGLVTVHGKPPADARARIAYVPLEARLPEALRVDEICDLAADVRGEPRRPASARLATLGLEALARRKGATLSVAEARAVLLAIALTSNADVLLVEEPLALLDPVAPSRSAEALRARASAGSLVVVTTASVRDATHIGDQTCILAHGAFAAIPPALAHVGAQGAALRVVVAQGRAGATALVAALAAESAVASVETAAYAANGGEAAPGPAVVVVASGPDLLSLAQSVTRAIAASRVDVEAIESAVMPLDVIRATLAAPLPGAMAPPARALAPHVPSVPPPPSNAPPVPPGGGAA